MKDQGQQARASENFAGPVDFETPRPDLPVHFLNFHETRAYESLKNVVANLAVVVQNLQAQQNVHWP